MCCSCCKQCFVCVFQPSPPPVKNYGLSLTNTHCAWLVPSLLGLNICKWSRNGRGRLLYVWHLCVDGQTTGDELATVLIAWITTSLRSKHFQSSYCAKVRAEAKKRLKGEGEGRRGNACPQTTILENAPWYFTVRFICKLTARQNRNITNRLPLDYRICKITFFSNWTRCRRLQEL